MALCRVELHTYGLRTLFDERELCREHRFEQAAEAGRRPARANCSPFASIERAIYRPECRGPIMASISRQVRHAYVTVMLCVLCVLARSIRSVCVCVCVRYTTSSTLASIRLDKYANRAAKYVVREQSPKLACTQIESQFK